MNAKGKGYPFSQEQCPFFTGGLGQSCLAVEGSMRCSLFEIERYCTREEHALCPVYRERTRTQELVPLEMYEVKLLAIETQQVVA